MNLKLSDIQTNGGTQSRVQLDWIAIDEYAKAMLDGAQFPPVVVFYDGTDYWLADGFHRVEAAKYANLIEIAVDVRQGTKRDAILYSVGANADYGVRRTNADKRTATLMLLRDEEWSKKGSGWIAEKCRVTDRYVRKLIDELDLSRNRSEIAVHRNGSTYTMNTTNIGKAAPATAQATTIRFVPPVAPDEDEQFLDDLTTDPDGYDDSETILIEQQLAGWTMQPPPPTNGDAPTSKLSVHFSSDTPEHYTPESILDLVIAVMGEIDLDPCSNSKTTPNVPATAHYTTEDDGLTLPWCGVVYMNPPYGRVIGEWVTKLVSEFESGSITQAIALVPARVDTEWWNNLTSCQRTIPLVCFVRGRLTFIGNEDPAPFPSALVYLGDNRTEFYSVFSSIGRIWATWNDELAGLVDYGSA